MRRTLPSTMPPSPLPARGDDIQIVTRGVTKTYEHGAVQALRGVDLSVRRGEIVAIVGPSGSGKSTLLHLLGGLDSPTSGEILYEGEPLGNGGGLDRFRATKIGFVFQSFHLLPTLTALQNVQIPMFETERSPARRREAAEGLLRRVGLAHRAHHLPSQLSVGERQRVAIARALANDPAVILADEPTGSLDSATAEEIMSLLHGINRERGTTIVIVTHAPAVAGAARRTIRILDGRVVGQGAPSPDRPDPAESRGD